ncbi:esterase family protein [Oceanotoga sp. DSM 15011]|uniref:alpha/beta hydrolase n=1 Tax=unclassified Oceanotoga TaxID=2618448 RepID=UPI0021F46D8F|nr:MULTISPECIES: alpha/beta hydrolase family protein [unclassified Oceanotoga]MDN5341544.1 putative tributyrin esterase [Oceanotoga sp.]UYP00564.1 esterase family protein [Oceanotoga sp. DSM 15011]
MIFRGKVFSSIFEMETNLTVVIPNNSKDISKCKVSYLLHGLCGSSGDWLDYTQLPIFSEEYNIIFIMPDASRSFYTDMKYGLKYFTYVNEELPTLCKNIFNINTSRENTSIIGNSMGGYGALKSALTFPEKYGVCCSFSPACLFLKEGLDFQRNNPEKVREFFGERIVNDFESIFGEELLWNSSYEILDLMNKINDFEEKPKIYISCGLSDGLIKDCNRLANEMKSLNFDFFYDEFDGNHDWYFFNESLKRSMSII